MWLQAVVVVVSWCKCTYNCLGACSAHCHAMTHWRAFRRSHGLVGLFYLYKWCHLLDQRPVATTRIYWSLAREHLSMSHQLRNDADYAHVVHSFWCDYPLVIVREGIVAKIWRLAPLGKQLCVSLSSSSITLIAFPSLSLSPKWARVDYLQLLLCMSV